MTVKSAKSIYVYDNNISMPMIVTVIDSADFPEDFLFYPIETILSPVDLSVVLIRNIDSIVIVRNYGLRTEYVSRV